MMKTRTSTLSVLIAAVLGLAFGAIARAQGIGTAAGKPNIIFILVDNLGWGDFGVYGGTIPTPRIDELAREGIRFTNYNVEVMCTPSRSAIMTGRHPVRSGTYTIPSGLAPWEYTIAELLSDSGYSTALFGKWHLGDKQGRLPNDQGFDEWWGVLNSWDEAGYTAYPLFKESGMPAPMIWEGKKGARSRPVMPLDLKVRPIVDEQYIIPKTVEYIRRNAAAKKPFFVYVGYSELHQPLMANPNFANKSIRRSGVLADIIAEMDYRVGQVLDAIREAGVEDNTIVILSSDNAGGGESPQAGTSSNGPWRGNFFNTPFEGSMRVPAMIRWPGKVPAGLVTEQMLAAVDWLTTLAAVVGASNRIPRDRPIDGVDASAFMLGRSETTGRDSYMFFGADGKLMSVKWKVYKTIFRYTDDRPAIQSAYIEPQLPLVYDLSSDPHENVNLFWTHMTNGWIVGPTAKLVAEYQRSVQKYPNIQVGADFKGYGN